MPTKIMFIAALWYVFIVQLTKSAGIILSQFKNFNKIISILPIA